MIAKLYLIAVGLLYLGLAMWCSLAPRTTSEKVGFELVGGSGKSEFLTVYGGLEFGMGLLLVLAVFKPETVGWGLLACVVIHGCLVLFRSIGFLIFDDLEPMTYQLAVGEWVILLAGIVIWWLPRGTPGG